MNPAKTANKKDLIVKRLLNAPVELVWKAWTEPEHIMRWWGPNYFTSPSCKMDFRVGGRAIVCMRSPDGQDMYSTWDYTLIQPMERIEYIQNLSDAQGTRIDPASLGMPDDFPQEVRTVITFKPVGDKAELTVAEYGFPDSHMFELAELGLNQSIDKLVHSITSG